MPEPRLGSLLGGKHAVRRQWSWLKNWNLMREKIKAFISLIHLLELTVYPGYAPTHSYSEVMHFEIGLTFQDVSMSWAFYLTNKIEKTEYRKKANGKTKGTDVKKRWMDAGMFFLLFFWLFFLSLKLFLNKKLKRNMKHTMPQFPSLKNMRER